LIILDTSGLLAAIDASQRHHSAAAAALVEARVPRLLSPFVLAELDYLVSTRVSTRAAHALLREVADGAYQLESFDSEDVARALEIQKRFDDLDLSLADASILVLSGRHQVLEVLTLDERHFRAVRGYRDEPLRLLPEGLGG
jgi:predicted nucleic acid-binding protein